MNDVGHHNLNPDTVGRLQRGNTYKDLSTAIVVPTRGMIPARVVSSWIGLMRPMNQMTYGPEFFSNDEVGIAYNKAIEWVLSFNQALVSNKQKPFKYVLTLEEDNAPQPDGLLTLLESIENFDAVGGLYYTKGEAGQPMIYGAPGVLPKNFIPQPPLPNQIQPCNGLGMGFTLFRVALFEKMAPDMPKNNNGIREWFKTVQEWDPDRGGRQFTQDLWFFDNATKYGGRFACDTRVKVGHYDFANDKMW